jgi:hypothetical protein
MLVEEFSDILDEFVCRDRQCRLVALDLVRGTPARFLVSGNPDPHDVQRALEGSRIGAERRIRGLFNLP